MERIGLMPGSEIGGYTVVAPLGTGGMGTVYRALDGGGAPVALKLLHPQVGADAAARKRLLREVAALQRLRHPAVAAVLDAEADSTEAFLVTELVDGLDLEAHVAEHGPLRGDDLLALACGLRDALAAVHDAGVLHRDLKPANVLMTEHGPVLIDFGLAQGTDDARVTSVGLVVGTPGYLAPEVIDGAEPDQAADWWGWAALLVFAATGRPPFGKGRVTTVLTRARAGRPDLVGLGELTRGALTRALAADPAGRLAPDDVVAALTVVTAEGERMPRPRRTTAVSDGGGEATTALPSSGGPASSNGSTTAVLDGADAAGTLALAAAPSPTAVVPRPRDGLTRALGTASPEAEEADEGYWEQDEYDDPEYAAVEWLEEDLDASAGPEVEGSGYRRPSVPRRWATETALALLVVVAGAMRPGLTLVVAVATLLVARAYGSTVEAMHGRRERRGVRSSDGWIALATTPWHLVRAVIGVVPALLVAASVLVIGVGTAWWFVGRGTWTIGDNAPGDELAGTTAALLVGLAVLAGVLLLWWGPGSRLTRVGSRRLLEVVSPRRLGALVAVVLILAAAAVLWVQVRQGGLADFSPLPVPTVPQRLP